MEPVGLSSAPTTTLFDRSYNSPSRPPSIPSMRPSPITLNGHYPTHTHTASSPPRTAFRQLFNDNNSKSVPTQDELKKHTWKEHLKNWVTTKDPDEPDYIEPTQTSIYLTEEGTFAAKVIPHDADEVCVYKNSNGHQRIHGIPEGLEKESIESIKSFFSQTTAKVHRCVHGSYQLHVKRETHGGAFLYVLLKKENRELEKQFQRCLKRVTNSHFNVSVVTLPARRGAECLSDSGENDFNGNREPVRTKKVSIALNRQDKWSTIVFAFLAGLGFYPTTPEHMGKINDEILTEQLVELACGNTRGLDQIILAHHQAKVLEFNIAEDGSSLSVVVRGPEMRILFILGFVIRNAIIISAPTLMLRNFYFGVKI